MKKSGSVSAQVSKEGKLKMAIEKNLTAPGTVATVVATAAVTLAIGVTAAALGGYLVPLRVSDNRTAEQQNEKTPIQLPAALPAGQPEVVFVPVAPDAASQPTLDVPVPQDSGVRFAVHDTIEYNDDDDDDDDHRGRKYRGSADDEHDDDDHRRRGHHERDDD